jgi:CheY-like chemotaxis protein
MSRILLVDDSPHAQRMGERILSEEGFEVVTVSNADAALVRLEDVDPDVVLADAVMPGRTGYDICQYIKLSPRHRHVRVILTAGVIEPFDEAHTKQVEADATLRKPFEASVLLATVRPLAEAAGKDRSAALAGKPGGLAPPGGPPKSAQVAPFIAVVDAEQVRAAVTVALDAAMGAMVEEITRRVLATLTRKKPEGRVLESITAPPAAAALAPAPVPPPPPAAALPSVEPKPAMPPRPTPRIATVRRVTPLRLRTGSILGLDISRFEPEPPAGSSQSDPEAPAPKN